MEDDIVIKVEGVYKKFGRSLKRSMAYGAIDLARNFAGLPTDQGKLRKTEFWALQDINFELKRGETLGIIGVNGSGKSTLLRVLTGIFPPDKGKVMVRGKIGALIAVGAGFHPHFTGRENIYLNATILGMTKEEIDERFDDIVRFADIGDFLDAPVSTYSSGMRVRLGFSVAVFTKPDILLIDEVLSVGDITFQRKATERIEKLKENCATIFISHSMRHVARICDKAILLNGGKIEMTGPASEVITYYVNQNIVQSQEKGSMKIFATSPDIKDVSYNIKNLNGEEVTSLLQGDPFTINVNVQSERELKDVMMNISIMTGEGSIATFMNTEHFPFSIKKGENQIQCKLKGPRLLPNTYYFKIKMIYRAGPLIYEADTDNIPVLYKGKKYQPYMGYYFEDYDWSSSEATGDV